MEGVQKEKQQKLLLVNRNSLAIDGVTDVKSFDESLVGVNTVFGALNIEGRQLRITKYLMQTGEISVEGVIDAVVYLDNEPEKKGLLSRLAR